METQSLKGRAATLQTWRNRKTVRDLLAEIMAANKGASRTKLRREFLARIRDDDDSLEAVADYAFDAAYTAYSNQRDRYEPNAEQRSSAKAAEDEEVKATKESIKAQILLLNQEMPNGKRMRYCSGEEMLAFGKGFERIGRKVGKTKRVGEVLSEEEVRELMGR